MPRSAAFPDENYNFGVTRIRQNAGVPTAQPPANTPVYAPPPPAYTINQSAQHQNAIADVDRQIAAEKDPAIRQRLVARKNEMQFAYRSHQPYPDYAGRAAGQQALQTGVSVTNAQVAGQTAVGAMRAQAPVAAAAINSQGRVEAAKVTGESRQNVAESNNAARRDVATTNAQARQFTAQESARARIIAAKINAAKSIGGVMPSPEDQAYLKDFIANGGTVDQTPAPTTQPGAKPTQSTQSTATQSFPAQEPMPDVGPTPEARVATALPTVEAPALPQATAAPYDDPFVTSVPEPAPRPAPVTGDAADPNSKTGIKLDAGNYGTSAKEYNDRKAKESQPEFSDHDRAAYQAYRQSTGDRSISMRRWIEDVKRPHDKYQRDFASTPDERASVRQTSFLRGQAENAKKVADASRLASLEENFAVNNPGYVPQYPGARTPVQARPLPTITPPQAKPVAQQAAPLPTTQPATQPTPIIPATQPAPAPQLATVATITPTAPTLMSNEQFEQRYGALRTPTVVPAAPPVAQTQPAQAAVPGTAAPRMTPNPDGTFSNPQFPGVRYMKVTGGFKRI